MCIKSIKVVTIMLSSKSPQNDCQFCTRCFPKALMLIGLASGNEESVYEEVQLLHLGLASPLYSS